MKRFLTIMFVAFMAMGTAFAKGGKQVVVFNVDLHCQGCVNKIEKNIAFEKGVKDLQCSLTSKTVMVTFDPEKTSIETLQEAFKALGKPATVNEAATKAVKDGQKVDGQTGATTKK